MDREEQIKEKEAMVSDLDKNSKCFILGFSEEWTTEDFVDELYRLGYRKIVWHKVADGDLPKKSKAVVVFLDVNCDYYVGPYDKKDEIFHTNIGFDISKDRIIAWTELPEYKEK